APGKETPLPNVTALVKHTTLLVALPCTADWAVAPVVAVVIDVAALVMLHGPVFGLIPLNEPNGFFRGAVFFVIGVGFVWCCGVTLPVVSTNLAVSEPPLPVTPTAFE